jgi:hypothetical protein
VQQAGDLILADSICIVAKANRDSRAHAGGPHRMGTIVSTNQAFGTPRIWTVIERHQARD